MGKVKKSKEQKNIATPSLGVGVFTFEIKRILSVCIIHDINYRSTNL